MGNKNTKSSLRNAIIYLNISADEISDKDEKFWNQIFTEDLCVADDVIRNITVQEIRMLRDGSPKNFATLAYKMVERLCLTTASLCNTQSQQTAVLNAVRILMRMLPIIFEDRQWRNFMRDNRLREGSERGSHKKLNLTYPCKRQDERNYAAYLPPMQGSRSGTPINPARRDSDTPSKDKRQAQPQVGDLLHDDQMYGEATDTTNCKHHDNDKKSEEQENRVANDDKGDSLMKTLILSICDLLFCPEFTVLPHGDSYLANAVDGPPEDLKSLSTYDYVWEPGVGFDSSVNSTTYYDKNRSELLRAILVCLSATLYEAPGDSMAQRNDWMELFVSQDNRHALPLFTSLLNVIFSYKSPRTLLQLNNLLFESCRERLVELSCQLLIAALDYNSETSQAEDEKPPPAGARNLFTEYLSRIHREEDFMFLIRGFIRLMNNGLEQGYLWTPTRCIDVDQELQMLLWKICNSNKRFLQYLLASNELLDMVVPIMFHLNENFQETSKTALIHIGVFNLLILSGERNFGVRLNKPYAGNLLGNLPEFSGTHADLMIVVFHKLIMYGYKISQLYDYLLTVLVNVSPYLKGTTILACKCMIQLFETFSSVLVVFTEPNYHQLVISLLEIFNNLIQYQFDGNANLVYIILSKKDMFLNLANLATTQKSIDKVLRKLYKRKQHMEQSLSGASARKDNQEAATSEEGAKDLDKSASNQDTALGDADLDLGLAIVSCTNIALNPGSDTKRHEVSLVATPDLQHTTQPIHPFDTDIDEAPSLAHHRPNKINNNNNNNNESKVCLDDILIEAADYEPLDSPIRRSTNDRASAKTAPSTKQFDLMCDDDNQNVVDDPTPGDNQAVGLVKAERRESAGQSSQAESQSNQCDKWRPTAEWLKAWKQTLPLQTILRMICALEPQVEQFKRTSGRGPVDESEVIKFLQSGTLVGLLPVPHPIQIRKYRTNSRSTMWFRAYTWGIIYVRNSIWIGTDIRLINIL